MKKILYSAQDSRGKPVTAFVEAASAADALAQLQSRGFQSIVLHDDPHIQLERDHLEGLDERSLARLAEFEVRIRKGQHIGLFLQQVLLNNAKVLLGSAAVAGWAVYARHPVTAGLALLVLLGIPGIALWQYRRVTEYNALLKACALGQGDQVRERVARLRPVMTAPAMAFDLDLREACVRAQESRSATEALAGLAHWREHFDAESPGVFESRIATVYHAAGQFPAFVEAMRAAYAASPKTPTFVVDLALAEARLGDLEAATRLLAEVNPAELPPHGQPFVHWAFGMIALRHNEPVAAEPLRLAMEGLLEYKDNPAVWTALALVTAAYAVAISRHHRAEALQLLASVQPVVVVHADRFLRILLQEALPEAGIKP